MERVNLPLWGSIGSNARLRPPVKRVMKKITFWFLFRIGEISDKKPFWILSRKKLLCHCKGWFITEILLHLSLLLSLSISLAHTHTLSRFNSCSFFASRMYSYYHFFRWIYEPSCILLHRSTFSVRYWVRMLNYFQLKIRMWLAKPSWSDLTSEAQQLGIQAVLGWPTAQQL